MELVSIAGLRCWILAISIPNRLLGVCACVSFGLVRIFSNRLAALSSSSVHSLVSFESLLANASFEAALGSSSASAGGRVAHAVGPKVPEVGGVGSELGGRCGRRDIIGREDRSGWIEGEGGT